jgi:hypothetical protein
VSVMLELGIRITLIDKTTRGEVYQFPNRFSNGKSAGPNLFTLTTIIVAERRALTSNYPRRFLVITYDLLKRPLRSGLFLLFRELDFNEVE